MTNKIFFGIITLWISSSILISAQQYGTSTIPDSLLQNANCVIREQTREVILSSVNAGEIRVKLAMTILNVNGDDNALLKIPYDEDSSVSIDQITLYDASGKKIRKAKESEIFDFPAYTGSLYSDLRLKIYKPSYGIYPYTVEYIYTTKSKNMISYGHWSPVYNYNVSVESANIKLTVPKKNDFNIKEIMIGPNEVTTDSRGYTTKWSVSNLKAYEDEPFNNSLNQSIPSVYLMPKELVFNNNKGNAESWKDYGKWVYELYEGRMEISEPELKALNSLVALVPDTLERIKTLYKYMQNRTRYVSIQVGIGGFQPFSAITVYETGYGDCKALSNYMHSILSAFNIKSYPALVQAGRHIEPLFKDFPNFNQLNHVILCVPQRTDTIWLECTSQTIPFGFLGDFTDNRDVLLLTEEGGKFAHTKSYTAKDNFRSSNSTFVVDTDGTALFKSNTNYQCLQYDDIMPLILANYDDRKKWIYSELSLPSMQINNFNLSTINATMPSATLQVEAITKNYGTLTGSYLMLPLNKINVITPIKRMVKTRQSNITIERAYTDCDTINFSIPDSYKIESIPTDKYITSKFGTYSYIVKATENQITYIRNLTTSQGIFPSSDYKDFYDFTLAVSKADGVKAILRKKNE